MGIGDDFPKGRQIDFVLGRFTNEEFAVLATMMDKACSLYSSDAADASLPADFVVSWTINKQQRSIHNGRLYTHVYNII